MHVRLADMHLGRGAHCAVYHPASCAAGRLVPTAGRSAFHSSSKTNSAAKLEKGKTAGTPAAQPAAQKAAELAVQLVEVCIKIVDEAKRKRRTDASFSRRRIQS